MIQRIAFFCILSITALAVAGCHVVAPFIGEVLPVVSTANMVLDEIERFLTSLLNMGKITKEQAAQASAVLGKTRSAALALQHAAEGAESANDKKYLDAFASFEMAYNELLTLTAPYGVKAMPIGVMGLRADGETLSVPPADSFRLRAQ